VIEGPALSDAVLVVAQMLDGACARDRQASVGLCFRCVFGGSGVDRGAVSFDGDRLERRGGAFDDLAGSRMVARRKASAPPSTRTAYVPCPAWWIWPSRR
jgi:hypothetical protein